MSMPGFAPPPPYPTTKKFWAVWRQTGGSAPTKRHKTKDAAIGEAARLAQQTAESYYVLEVVGVVSPVQTPINYSELK